MAFIAETTTMNMTAGKNDVLGIIDWESAHMEMGRPSLEQKGFHRKWLSSDVGGVIAIRDKFNDRVETPLYAGIRILAGATYMRGLIDDTESLWYATLHMLAAFDNKEVHITYHEAAYVLFNSASFVFVRAERVLDPDEYLHSFMIYEEPIHVLHNCLDKLYKILFMKNGKIIGMRVANDPYDYVRDYFPNEVDWLFWGRGELNERLSGKNLGNFNIRKEKVVERSSRKRRVPRNDGSAMENPGVGPIISI